VERNPLSPDPHLHYRSLTMGVRTSTRATSRSRLSRNCRGTLTNSVSAPLNGTVALSRHSTGAVTVGFGVAICRNMDSMHPFPNHTLRARRYRLFVRQTVQTFEPPNSRLPRYGRRTETTKSRGFITYLPSSRIVPERFTKNYALITGTDV